MTPAGKTLVETGSADVVHQNSSWNLGFGSANVGSLWEGEQRWLR